MSLLVGIVTKPVGMTQAAWVFLNAAGVWGGIMAGIVFLFWFFGRKKSGTALLILFLLAGAASALTPGEISSIQSWATTQAYSSVPRLYRNFYKGDVSYTSQVEQVERDRILVRLENKSKVIAGDYGITNGMRPKEIFGTFRTAYTDAPTVLAKVKVTDDKHTYLHGYIASKTEVPTGATNASVMVYYKVEGDSPAEANGVTNVPIREFEAALNQ